MSDTPTQAAMRLAEVSLDASLNEHVLEIDEDGKVTRVDQLVIALALDDAGVREAVEACEKMTEVAKARENVTVRLIALEGLAHRALSALTGETRDRTNEEEARLADEIFGKQSRD